MKKALFLLLFMTSMTGFAQGFTGYRNPIINADVPDVSLCNDGKYYYMISTTMHLMPGGPIMRSKDLQHWETISYVFQRIEDGDRYNLIDSKTVYGQSQWASSIRYHEGKFWVWFTCNGAPGKGFLYTAKKAEGPWTLVARPPHFHDSSLFFDDDGRVYMFHGTGNLTELDPKTFQVKEGGINKVIFQRDADEQGLLEGSSVMKHNGKYYLCMISMDWSIPGRLRREVCYRADNIEGPYTKKIILETAFESYGGVGQGCLVEPLKAGGNWNAVVFQDRGGIGRVPCLMPCRWIDDWPMLGDENGHIPNDLSTDYIHQTGIIGSDEFNGSKLELYWQWNHNPVDSAWSISKGKLHLATARIVPNIFLAPNTLTQRMEGPECTGTVKLDISQMHPGDICGLSAFNSDCGSLCIYRTDDNYEIRLTEEHSIFNEQEHSIRGDSIITHSIEVLPSGIQSIYLRVHADFNPGQDLASFSYSLDDKEYILLPYRHKMTFDYTRMFMGTKFAIFNFATKSLGGSVNVDWFHYCK